MSEHQPDSPGVQPVNVPNIRTSFVGREKELEEISQLIKSSRMTTILGTAGCGKTRLAAALAGEMGTHFQDGVIWIDLAVHKNADLIPGAITELIQIGEQPGQGAMERILDALKESHCLLILDNCEHLIPEISHIANKILEKTQARLLTTSREPLGVQGETLYPLSGLSLPRQTYPAGDWNELKQFEAIQLFIQRAKAVLPSFNLNKENANLVLDICRELDGLPLAIELASARINVLSLEQIANRLKDQFDLLSKRTHAAYSHHDTLRAAIEWSYDLLFEEEKLMLRRLSVFSGSCSLKSIKAVCVGQGIKQEEILPLISSLVERSLVVAETLQLGEARYSLLETIRHYAEEKLQQAGNFSTHHNRHLDYYLELTEDKVPKLRGQYQELWLNWLEREIDNLRAALAWSLKTDQIEKGLRVAIALYPYWTIRDHAEEGFKWFKELLAQVGESTSPVVHANALAYAVFLAGFRGNTEAQITFGQQGGELARTVEGKDPQALVWALNAQAYGARAAGDYHTELILGKQIIQLRRELEQRYFLGIALSTYSFTAMTIGNFEEAREMLDEGLPLLRELRVPYRIAMALNFSGDLSRCQSEYNRARKEYQESITLLRELDAVRDLASALHNLGHTYLHLGDAERAQSLFQESIDLHREQGNRQGVIECLLGFAALAVSYDQPVLGLRLLSAAAALGGEDITSKWAATRMEYEHYMERVREDLSASIFRSEKETGRNLTLEKALDDVRKVVEKIQRDENDRQRLQTLTPREIEVTTLIAQAKSNGEIAQELVISKRTVEKHISNIRSKLGFTKRAEIVRWAMRTGLTEEDN